MNIIKNFIKTEIWTPAYVGKLQNTNSDILLLL
jgi:hypothetical protein